MAKLYAVYQRPGGVRHYCLDTHVPPAKKIPGLRSYDVTRGDVMGMTGKHAVYPIATLSFDSMAAISAAPASPENQAAPADLAKFDSAGVDMMFCDTRTI